MLCWFLLLVVPCLSATYKAAIASHQIADAPNVQDAIVQNLALYKEHASLAKANGAQIVVYPEFGIDNSGTLNNRQNALQFGETIPSAGVILCGNNSFPLIIQTLSCLAKQNSIVVVANVYDKQPCNQSCADNQYLYNTEVAFDEQGRLISKYYKTHVWYTSIFDTPKNPTLTNFTTSFGVNFGMMVCFDIAFGSPGPKLVERGITHFPYSVAQGIVGPLVVKAWTLLHSATVLSGNLGSHIGAYRHGKTLDGKNIPLSNGRDSLFIVDVPK
eukprot:TRINITY_DN5414_c0_g2_i1.p1 TRINITY_DN5414_c0_g2~~TRINITY_DN5414_c0_g2_i1.p1  ORF type:complete len:272 (-),score=53.92 TRINITY_DN5414_c0_g2_i1:29-844(-)